jgi:hypothetical protein
LTNANFKTGKEHVEILPVLAMLIATALGLFIGKDLYPTLFDAQSKTAAPLSTQPNHPQPLIVLGAEGLCRFSNIYTSLPPKCKTLDGKFVPVPGTSPDIFVPPGGK